ncbi:unnamed protein product, partial [Medioppia subpectinata]
SPLGLDKKSIRPNLLLGIIIRSKKHVPSQAPQNSTNSRGRSSVSGAGDQTVRSFTPPPKSSSNDSSPEDNSKDTDDVSYTPPRTASTTASAKSKSKTGAPAPKITTTITLASKSTVPPVIDDDDEPYDPEEVDLSSSSGATAATPASVSLDGQSTRSIPELMEQIARSSNPVEMTSSVLSAIAQSSNIELQRRLLEQLTAKVDEQKRQLEVQKAEAEASNASFAASMSSASSSSAPPLIPGLDGQFAASALKDITIPDNLQDILSTVKDKTLEIERQQERLRAVAAAGFNFDDPIVKNFGPKSGLTEPIGDSPEAMDLDDEDDDDAAQTKSSDTPSLTGISSSSNSSNSGDAVGVGAGGQPSGAAASMTTDPRLRSKKQTPLPSITHETGTDSRVAAMTSDELIEKAKQQMAAL